MEIKKIIKMKKYLYVIVFLFFLVKACFMGSIYGQFDNYVDAYCLSIGHTSSYDTVFIKRRVFMNKIYTFFSPFQMDRKKLC